MQRRKTREQILKANLNKSLNKLKYKVAESEEIWLDFINTLIPVLIDDEMTKEEVGKRVELVFEVANQLLDGYEERWGTNETK